MCKYNEWTNYETWNVMLWLNNEETLYFLMIAMLQNSDFPLTYRALIFALDLENETTGDGVAFMDAKLNYKELDNALKQIQKDL